MEQEELVSVAKFYVRKVSLCGNPCKNVIRITYDGKDVMVEMHVLYLVDKSDVAKYKGKTIKIFKNKCLKIAPISGHRIETLNEIVSIAKQVTLNLIEYHNKSLNTQPNN